jgi:peptide chain release factor subunit 3
MDINDDEKERGNTIEIGKACFDTDNKRITIFDAPGNKKYVPNVIKGIG